MLDFLHFNNENRFNYWNYRSRWILSSRVSIKKNYKVHGIKRKSSSSIRVELTT